MERNANILDAHFIALLFCRVAHFPEIKLQKNWLSLTLEFHWSAYILSMVMDWEVNTTVQTVCMYSVKLGYIKFILS